MNLLQKMIEKNNLDEEDDRDFPSPLSLSSAASHRPVLPIDLGICSDGLPVRIDLNDPELQPMALISSRPEEIKLLFEQLLHEMTRLYTANDLQFALLKRRESQYERLLSAAEDKDILLNFENIHPQHEWEFMYQAAESAERRFNGEEEIHPLLLLIEDLSVLSVASADFRLTFEWLCLYGAAVGIHLLAALTSDVALTMGRWLRYFPARILGPLPPDLAERFGLHGSLPRPPRLTEMERVSTSAGTQFAVYSVSKWLYFTPSLNAHNTTLDLSRHAAPIGDQE